MCANSILHKILQRTTTPEMGFEYDYRRKSLLTLEPKMFVPKTFVLKMFEPIRTTK
jgi:hypothetical protein